MPLISQSITDYQYSWHVSTLIGASKSDSISDLERQFFGAQPTESLVDARRRYLLANIAGTLPTDSLADLDRKYYAAVLGPIAPQLTNQDAEYLMYKGLAPIDYYQSTNLLTANQASIETDLAGFRIANDCTIARSTAQASHGAASLALTCTSAANGYMGVQVSKDDASLVHVVGGGTYMPGEPITGVS
jgi:hypothetical protein